jgi:hypothetical protein
MDSQPENHDGRLGLFLLRFLEIDRLAGASRRIT